MAEITIENYFGRHEIYRFMPRSMFDKLRAAFLAGWKTCQVDDSELREIHRKISVFRFAKIHNISESLAEKILTEL